MENLRRDIIASLVKDTLAWLDGAPTVRSLRRERILAEYAGKGYVDTNDTEPGNATAWPKWRRWPARYWL